LAAIGTLLPGPGERMPTPQARKIQGIFNRATKRVGQGGKAPRCNY